MKDDWTDEVDMLHDFFSKTVLPDTPYRFNECMVIHDMKKFLKAHFGALKTHNGVPVYKPCLDRLYELKKQLENGCK